MPGNDGAGGQHWGSGTTPTGYVQSRLPNMHAHLSGWKIQLCSCEEEPTKADEREQRALVQGQ